ncbi:MAG TPA: peptide chain release factor N(5)-glutamine methyltransferase [Planctomycetaceae bacterium]|nr:peptide chain release factor N(5)-glutamine methyltransferase [Planctomycetaceae bacterium]
MSQSIIELLQACEQRLFAVDSPRLSAELLIAHVLECSRLDLVLNKDRMLASAELSQIEELVARREGGEPIAYILGSKEFFGLDFEVAQGVLIPRPETEHLVEAVQERFSPDAEIVFADLGTGSGILAVTIATLFPNAKGVAVDLSPEALKIASRNSVTHGVSDRVSFVQADFTCPLFQPQSFDLIVTNPPYVPLYEYESASHEVVSFEPRTALVSGVDGLDHMRLLLPHVEKALRSNGSFLSEIGYQHGDQLVRMFTDNWPEFYDVLIRKDLSGHDRIIISQRR